MVKVNVKTARFRKPYRNLYINKGYSTDSKGAKGFHSK